MGLLNGRKVPHCAIGRMIDVRLAQLQWQQADLALVLSCSVAYISAVVTGRKRLAADGAWAFAAALDLNAYEILREQSAELLGDCPDEKYFAITIRAAALSAAKSTKEK